MTYKDVQGWGLLILAIFIGLVGFILLISEAEELSVLLWSKAIGIGLIALAAWVFKKL